MRGPSFPSLRVRLLVVSISLLVQPALAGCTQTPTSGDQATAPTADPGLLAFYDAIAEGPELHFDTDHGGFRVLLYPSLTPNTAAHIETLAADGFYDDTIVHRVVDDFVIQGGDPSRTGQAGSGTTVPFERHPELRFAEGAVGLARDLDPDSGDSQWFVAEKPAPHLDDPRGATGDVFGAYTLFGQVFEGLDVVRAIAAEPVVPGADRPIEDVLVHTVDVRPPPAIDLVDTVRTLDEDAQGRAELSRPLHLLAGHDFTVRVFQPDDATPWRDADVTYTAPDATRHTYALEALDDDPRVWTATVRLPHDPMRTGEPTAWQQSVTAEGALVLDNDVSVRPWHPDYGVLATPGSDD